MKYISPAHESKLPKQFPCYVYGMPKQGHICDTENLSHLVASL